MHLATEYRTTRAETMGRRATDLLAAIGWTAAATAALAARQVAATRSFITVAGWEIEFNGRDVTVSWILLSATLVAAGLIAAGLTAVLHRRHDGLSPAVFRLTADLRRGSLGIPALVAIGITAAMDGNRPAGSPTMAALSLTAGLWAIAIFTRMPIFRLRRFPLVERLLPSATCATAAVCLGWTIVRAVPGIWAEPLCVSAAVFATFCYSLARLVQFSEEGVIIEPQPSSDASRSMVHVTRSGILRRIATSAAMAVLIFVAWRSINEARHNIRICDGKAFTVVAWHMLQGDLPYRDVWDHKPPGIYFLGIAAQSLWGPGVEAFRLLEQFNAVALVLLLCGMGRRITGMWSAGLIASAGLLGVFFHRRILCGGIYTTEFGVTFVLLGMHAALFAVEDVRRGIAWSVSAGVMFACAVLLKEPFVFSIAAWFVYLSCFTKSWGRRRIPLSVWMVAGGAATGATAIGWAAYVGALSEWLDVIAYNVSYAREGSELEPSAWPLVRYLNSFRTFGASVVGLSPLLGGLAFAAIPACLDRSLPKRTRILTGMLQAQWLLEILAASLSSRAYLPYFHAAIVTYVLSAGCGGVWLAYRIGAIAAGWSRYRPGPRAAAFVWLALLAMSAVLPAVASQVMVTSTWSRLGPVRDVESVSADLIALIRRETSPSDRIWVPNPRQSEVYVDAERRTATRFFYLSPWLLLGRRTRSTDEVVELLRLELAESAPVLIALTPNMELGLTEMGLEPWLRNNYRRYTEFPHPWLDHWPRKGLHFDELHDAEEIRVYFRNDRVPK
jgi:4-amino-4-deoxy-L-arabinose transferase-like glycosyltransferase